MSTVCHNLASPLLTMHLELWGPLPHAGSGWLGLKPQNLGRQHWVPWTHCPTHMHFKHWQLERHWGTSTPGEGIRAHMWAVAMGWWYHSMPSKMPETNREAIGKSHKDIRCEFPLDTSSAFCEKIDEIPKLPYIPCSELVERARCLEWLPKMWPRKTCVVWKMKFYATKNEFWDSQTHSWKNGLFPTFLINSFPFLSPWPSFLFLAIHTPLCPGSEFIVLLLILAFLFLGHCLLWITPPFSVDLS